MSACALLAFASNAFAQDVEHTENKADQVIRSTGRVNPSSLGMEMSIPLGSYPGRGISVPISLNYSSKVWRMEYSESQPKVSNPSLCWNLHKAKYAENSTAGWTASIGIPYIEYTGRDNTFVNNGRPYVLEDLCNPGDNRRYIKRISVHLPSGETHELRAGDSAYADNPNTQEQWNTTYYAVDSSNLRYIEDSTTEPATYRLLMPDGSFYDLLPRLRDRAISTLEKGRNIPTAMEIM